MMKRKYIATLLAVVTASSFLTGCAVEIGPVTIGSAKEIAEKKASENGVDSPADKEISSESTSLDDDTYYILQKNEYKELYFGNASFDEGEVATSPSTERLLWYTDDGSDAADINSIPTIYSGDKLVYRYSDTLSEEFVFERFYDLGRSFGLYGLEETPSGRYSLTIDSEKMYPDSDIAADISSVSSESVILEQMETTKLRTGLGLVSDYGTIQNFARDEEGNIIDASADTVYRFLIYSGTYKNTVQLQPKYRILGSAEIYTSYDYNFIDDDVIQVNIPAWFQSGYYLINGIGLVRYINMSEEEYNALETALDMNVANETEGLEGNVTTLDAATLSANEGSNNVAHDMYGDHASELMSSMTIDDNGKYVITATSPGSYDFKVNLKYEVIEGGETSDAVDAYITLPNGKSHRMLYDAKEGTCTLNDVYLSTGETTIEFVSDMTGIKPTINITKHEE